MQNTWRAGKMQDHKNESNLQKEIKILPGYWSNPNSPAVEWGYLKMFVKVFFSFDYSNIGVL